MEIEVTNIATLEPTKVRDVPIGMVFRAIIGHSCEAKWYLKALDTAVDLEKPQYVYGYNASVEQFRSAKKSKIVIEVNNTI